MIRPGLVSVTFRDKSADEILRLAVSCGLSGIEWGENAHVMPGDAAGAAELYRKTIACGLQVSGYGSYFRLCTQESPGEAFAASLVSAEALHAPYLRIWAGNKPSAEADRDFRLKAAREARLVCDMAADKGIKVALEWHKNTLTDTNESAFAFLEETDHPNLYCLWQPTVALSMEERYNGLKQLGDRLLNLHVYYWPDGARAPLADGLADWRYYLGAVSPEQDRYAELEFVKDNTEEQLALDAKALHELLG